MCHTVWYAKDTGSRRIISRYHSLWPHSRCGENGRLGGTVVYQRIGVPLQRRGYRLHPAVCGNTHHCLLQGKEKIAQTVTGLCADDTGRLQQLWGYLYPSQCQYAHERECSRQHLLAWKLPQSRAIWRHTAILWPCLLQRTEA